MPRPTAPRVDAAQRDARALELRAGGASFRQIAGLLGVSVSTAWTCVDRGLAATRQEPSSKLRALERDRLDRLTTAATQVLQARHVVVSGGKIVTDDDDQPLVDHGPTLAAINTLRGLMERRARLEGLDAPARADVQIDGTLTTIDAIDQEVVRLEQELADLDPSYLADKQRKQATARDLAAFRTRWTQPGSRPADDPAAFVADALEVALAQLRLDPGEQEETVAAVERLLERVR
jgi:hypothetical protein